VHTSGGLLRKTVEVLAHLGPEVVIALLDVSSENSEDDLHLFVRGGGGVGKSAEFLVLSLSLNSLVNHDGGITTIVDQKCGTSVTGPLQCLQSAFPVLFEGLVLPGEDICGLGSDDSSCSVVLG